MARIMGYLMLVTALIISFNILGVQGLASSKLLNGITGVTDLSGLSQALIYVTIAGFITLFALAGSSISIFGTSLTISDISVASGVGLGLLLVLGDFIAVYQNVGQYGTIYKYISGFILLPIMIGFAWSVIDWVRGRD